MNKKGKTGFGTLVSIIFIAIVVLIVLSFLGINIPALAKTALGLSKIDLVNYTQKNDEAELAFDNLIKDIKDCEKDVNNNCACDGSLSKFYKTHKLEFNDTVGKLINVKERGEVLIAKKDIKVNCFFKNDKFDIEEKDIEIFFDKNLPYILNKGILNRDYKFVYDFILYKKNSKICWLTDTVGKNNIEKISYC